MNAASDDNPSFSDAVRSIGEQLNATESFEAALKHLPPVVRPNGH